MSLPTTGPISLGQVRTELNKTGSISLGNTDVRSLAGKTSGTIKMGDLRGKSNNIIFTTQLTVGIKKATMFNGDTYGYIAGSADNYFGAMSPNKLFGGTIVSFRQGMLLGSWYPYFQVDAARESYPKNFITIFPDGSEFFGYIGEKGTVDFIFGNICDPENETDNQRLFSVLKKYANQTITIKIKEVK